MGVGAFGGRPRCEGRGGGVGSAGGRGGERGAGAAEEVEGDVFEGELGVFADQVGQLAGLRVGFDADGELGDRARGGIVDREVDGEQRAEGVGEGLGQVDRSAEGTGDGVAFGIGLQDGAVFGVLAEQGCLHLEAADLGGVGAGSGAALEVDRGGADLGSEADLGARAGGAAVGLGGVGDEARGEGDGGVFERGGGELFELGVLGLVEVEVEAGGAVGEVGGRGRLDRRGEVERVAAREGDRVAGEVGAPIARFPEDAGLLPAVAEGSGGQRVGGAAAGGGEGGGVLG